MRESFPFSSPETNLFTNSYITTPQLTFLAPDNVPKMVLATVTIIWVGFSKYMIGTTNSNTFLSLGSTQSTIACPFWAFLRSHQVFLHYIYYYTKNILLRIVSISSVQYCPILSKYHALKKDIVATLRALRKIGKPLFTRLERNLNITMIKKQ